MVALHIPDPVTPVSDLPAPLVWVLHDGKAGMASQALGLAEAAGFPFVEKPLSVRRPWAWLPPRVGRAEFDLLFIPEHDRSRGPRIQVTRGAIHRVTAARLAAELRRFPALAGLPRPILGVLIGGSNRSYRLGLDRLAT